MLLQGYSELKVPLSDIAVNPYTVSELVRLCLRKEDAGEGASDVNNDEEMEVVSQTECVFVDLVFGLDIQVFISFVLFLFFLFFFLFLLTLY